MAAHPGKKLLFMGGEFGQFIEWKFDSSLDWFLLEYPMHKAMQSYVKELNLFYKEEPSLWEVDHSYKGFQWIDHQNYEQSIISFMRLGKKKEDFIIAVCNFTPVVYHNYKVGVPNFIHYKEAFNSDSEAYGGSNQVNQDFIRPELEKWHNQPYHIKITIPPLSTIFIKPEFDYRLEKREGGNENAEKRNDSNDTGRWAGQ
jgi:1,4-alpha-glucan branching enzyme